MAAETNVSIIATIEGLGKTKNNDVCGILHIPKKSILRIK